MITGSRGKSQKGSWICLPVRDHRLHTSLPSPPFSPPPLSSFAIASLSPLPFPSISPPFGHPLPLLHLMDIQLLIFLLFLVPSISFQLTIDDEEFGLNLQLIKHQPCPFKSDKSKWDRKLEFEAGNEQEGPKLVQRPNEPNCYSIGGKVTVFSEFKGEFSIYLELRSSANKKQVPEPCHNRKDDGCGGFGSCLYCDACQTLEENKGLKAQLLVDGKSISCGQELSPGSYENMELVFCLPNPEDMLKSQGLTKETFKSLIQTEDGTNLRSIGVFATIYVFDRDVRKLVQTQQKVETVYRKTKRTLFKDEPLPPDVYWSLPFNSVIKEQKMFVACHKIYGNMQIRNNK